MGLEGLIARLERDADARVEEIRSRAQAAADALAREEGRVSQRQRDEELESRRGARRARLEGEMAEARQRARRAKLEAQHALLRRIFSRADEAVRQSGDVALGDGQLSELLEEALFSLSGLEVVVRCSRGLRARLAPLVADRAVELEEDASMSPGLIATTRDGAVSVDNTIANRLARLRPRLAIELLAECAPPREPRA